MQEIKTGRQDGFFNNHDVIRTHRAWFFIPRAQDAVLNAKIFFMLFCIHDRHMRPGGKIPPKHRHTHLSVHIQFRDVVAPDRLPHRVPLTARSQDAPTGLARPAVAAEGNFRRLIPSHRTHPRPGRRLLIGGRDSYFRRRPGLAFDGSLGFQSREIKNRGQNREGDNEENRITRHAAQNSRIPPVRPEV